MNKKKLLLWLFSLAFFAFTHIAHSQQLLPKALLTKSKLVFYTLGDQGTGGKKQQKVAAAMEREAKKSGKPDFVLLLGDNFYNDGVVSIDDPQWQEKFERIYKGNLLKDIPFFAVLGNHDYRLNSDAQVQYTSQGKGSKRWQMPDKFYRVDLGQVKNRPLLRLVGLDTTNVDSFSQQAKFIKQSFKSVKNRPLWRIVAGHHPLYSASRHGPTKSMHPEILPAMQDSKVHLYLAGHDHNLQLIKLMFSPIQVVSGGGGRVLYPIVSGQEGVDFANSKFGFVKVVLSEIEMKIIFFNPKGRVLYETVENLW
ncbi:MAG: metallophosphoesterase [Magnetococcales bacterium]|nr:metallophosphoesterase [Magnetococcales bacterium]